MKKLILLAGFALAGLCASAQKQIYSEPITIFEGDTIKIVNFEHLLLNEDFKDEKGMKSITVTSSFDKEQTEHYKLRAMLASTEFVALGEKKYTILRNKYFTMKNLVTNEIYGIPARKSLKLDYYVVNLSQERRIAQEQYAHNLAAEKEIRGEWDTRINVKPYDIESDIATWNEMRIISINGTEYSFADITGCELKFKEVYVAGKIDHEKVAKDMRKKQGWGEIFAGNLGVAAGTIAAAASGVKNAIPKTELVKEYIVTITTNMNTRPVIEVNVGTNETKANLVTELINSIIASNEESASE